MQNVITKEMIAAAYDRANAAYVARKGASANVNKSGVNPDIAKGLKVWSGMSDATFSAVIALCDGIALCDAIAGTTNTKKAMRLPMFLSFIVSGDVRDLKGSARTAFLELCALVNGATNRDSLMFAATGTAKEGENVNLRDTSLARKLRMLAGSVKPSTEQTQNSVTFSAGGIAQTLGIASKDSRKSHPVVNSDSPILRAMLDRINRTAESTLFELTKSEEGATVESTATDAPAPVEGESKSEKKNRKGRK